MITCIVVDDDQNTVKVFSDILELMGLNVVGQEYSGQGAVELYKEHRPDIAFIDIVMPGTDGFFALEGIKKINSDAKVIAVSADCTLETKLRLDKIGITAIIHKPFSQNEIKQILFKKYKINVK